MKNTTLTEVAIWDGHQRLDANAICLQGDRILAIGDAADLSHNATVIPMPGTTVIPGLIDAHVHLELNPDDKVAPAGTADNAPTLMRERAAGMVKAGITTARDLGGGAWHELALRDAIAQAQASGPRLVCSGQPITCPSGHCHFWGGEAANLEEAKSVLQRQLDHNVDLIKVMATGGRLTKGSDPTTVQFDVSTLTDIVAMAHDNGKSVAAHCHGTEGIRVAAQAGVNTIEHCSWVGEEGWASDYQPEIATLVLEQGIWVSPTVNKGWQRMLDSKTGAVLGRVRAAYKAMRALGIPMIASTDAGIPGVYHAELPPALVVFAAIAELSNEEALTTATANAAKALGLETVTGRLAPGLSADLLVVDGDPLSDLSAITRPAAIWARGQAVA